MEILEEINLSDFTNIRQNGKIAMKLNEKDELVSVIPCGDKDNILLATRLGKAIRFDVNDVRVFVGRGSSGVRGIRLKPNDFCRINVINTYFRKKIHTYL